MVALVFCKLFLLSPGTEERAHMEDGSAPMSWFTSPVYNRYWQHYGQAMAWHQRHRRAYQKALEAASGPIYRRQRERYADWRACQSDSEEEEESSSDDEIECDVSNMEISEELRQYFAQTEKHKEELRQQQQLEAEQGDSYVPADRDLRSTGRQASVAPPTERPGERRGAEMKKLYGEDAAKILAMETAMQLTFDRNCDRKQPKYWPVIPLRL
ncbi:gem-associated protein 8 isoform X2 [Syngnathus typhle]|uniref:gem-associated protein 8 isoform X2 n=1 Tax=Syngnathus typhle TaxID=161592 RepID=UPI002A6A4BAD|nr:gem-associated protein 8 isoform X2 [Syngnathus typhle]